MTNTNFEGAETSNSGDFNTTNDFRRVCLVKDPNSGGSAATATTLRAVKAVLLASASGSFTVDEKITQTTTGAIGKVVEWDNTNKILYYVQTRFNNAGLDTNGNLTAFSGTNTITGADSGITGTPSTSTSTVDSLGSAEEINALTPGPEASNSRKVRFSSALKYANNLSLMRRTSSPGRPSLYV